MGTGQFQQLQGNAWELCEEVAGVSTQSSECKLWGSHLSSLSTASRCQELPVQNRWAEDRSMTNTREQLSSASLMGMDQDTELRAPETGWRTARPKSDSWLQRWAAGSCEQTRQNLLSDIARFLLAVNQRHQMLAT